MDGPQVEAAVRVRYAETDQMGVAYHSNYFVWMEVARVAYCRAVGFEYRDMERLGGVYLAVTEAQCRYLAPARFDDEVQVTCRLLEARSRTLRFAYEMRRGADLLAAGETLHAVTDAQGRSVRLPKEYSQYFPSTRQDPAADAVGRGEGAGRGGSRL